MQLSNIVIGFLGFCFEIIDLNIFELKFLN